MKRNIPCGALILLASSLAAADSDPKADVAAAAKTLGEKTNYTWKTTSVVPESSQFRPGPIEGKTEKDGFTYVTLNFFDNSTQAVLKGDKAAITDADGKWQALTETESSEGPGRLMAMIVRNLKTPAVQAAELLAVSKDLKKDGEIYSGELTDEGAKKFLTFSRQGADGATANSAKGSVRFWVSKGMLSKYEYRVKGTASFGDNDLDIERTTTVEIKEVGTTKVVVPDDAKKKL